VPQNFLSFSSVEYSYPSSIHPVLKNVSFDLYQGWTGIIGENGAGKTTLLLLAAGILKPGAGSIRKPDALLYCPQRTDYLPEGWEDFFSSEDAAAARLMARLRIEYDWPYRWDSLSHGERKRLQLAVMLAGNPVLFAADEPTNHLDREAKTLIADILAEYSGIGLLVSHDRALVDRLCRGCLFLEEGTAVFRPGGVSRGLAENEREQLEKKRVREQIQKEQKRLAAEAGRRKRLADTARGRLSKKNIDAKDHDARGKINLARLTGKDAVGANLYKRMENRLEGMERKLEAVHTRAGRKTGVSMEGSVSKADRLFALQAGSITIGGGALFYPELAMAGRDRIALTGPNGSGKSTLLRHILKAIPPPAPVFYLPQELTETQSKTVLEEILKEGEKSRGEILSRFSRLGSDPRNILQSRAPSPGEVRKLLIARAVFHNPALIIMDEPTNHLDLKSILLLEEMLAGCRPALLLVSHDDIFLSRLTEKKWIISRTGAREILRVE
jgi:ATPase subunit of ABC transporter with duplicated ATPase domains